MLPFLSQDQHPHQEFIQINTSNILFICGGAFDGLEKIIQKRIGEKSMGFNAEISSKKDTGVGEIFKNALPEDLIRYGLIPEFVGRLPVLVSLGELDKEALVSILTEPKNALIKQYQKLFSLEDVDLEIEKEALLKIAEKTLIRNTGARGLRAILEEIMMEIMYEIPSRKDIKKVIINEDVIANNAEPVVILKEKIKKSAETA